MESVNTERLGSFFRGLTDIYSPSGKEVEALEYVERFLEAHSVPYRRLNVDDKRYNLFIGSDSTETDVLFVGHIDTVPAFDLDHYQMSVEGTTAFGLGTADMKSGCAAMIEAFTSHYERGGEVAGAALSLVVGEEEAGDGAAALVNEVHASWSVVAEPTDLVPALAHYGYIEIELDTSGERSHASMAKTNDSAVKTMLNVLLKISQHLEAAHPELICNIRDVHSSEGGFAVSDRCSASVDLHVPPNAKLGNLIAEIEELNQGMDGRRAELSFETVHNGYDLPMQGVLPDIITKVYKEHDLPLKTAPFRSHSDASILWASGIRPVILGPGQLSKAHTYHESVEIPQVEQAAHIYYRMLGELRKKNS